jgi:hypothetical protein
LIGNIPAANINLASFTQAALDCLSGYGGALLDFESTHSSLQRLGEQFQISTHYDAGELRALFKPRVSALGSTTWSFSPNDIFKGQFTIKRLPINELFNKIKVQYSKDWRTGEYAKTKEYSSATSITNYGKEGLYEVEADFIKTDAQALALGNQILDYNGWIVDILEAVLTRDFITIKRGDLIGGSTLLKSWPLMEVLEVEIQPGAGTMPTTVKILAYERNTG